MVAVVHGIVDSSHTSTSHHQALRINLHPTGAQAANELRHEFPDTTTTQTTP